MLASFINPSGHVPDEFTSDEFEEENYTKSSLPEGFAELMTNSCLVPAICAYLRNDSG